jgi:integrase
MKAGSYSDAFVKAVEYQGDGKKPMVVRREPGLILRISPQGKKSFFYRYMLHGKKRLMGLGAYDPKIPECLMKIRGRYNEARSLVWANRDPLEEKRQTKKKAETEEEEKHGKKYLSDLTESRLKDVKSRRTDQYYKEQKSVYDKLLDTWGKNREIERITRDDAEDYLRIIIKNGESPNHHLRTLKSLFGHAEERKWISHNPFSKIKKFPSKKGVKSCCAYPEDVKKVLAIAMASNPLDCAYLLLTIYTAARINEINKLRWTDIYDDHLILRTRKCKDSGEKERSISLNDTLKEVINQIPKKGEYVFMNPRTGTKYGYRDKFLTTLCKKAGVPRFTFHPLRHLAASILSDEGEALSKIQAVLGHEKVTTTAIYIQSLERGGASTDKIGKAIVIPINRKAA